MRCRAGRVLPASTPPDKHPVDERTDECGGDQDPDEANVGLEEDEADPDLLEIVDNKDDQDHQDDNCQDDPPGLAVGAFSCSLSHFHPFVVRPIVLGSGQSVGNDVPGTLDMGALRPGFVRPLHRPGRGHAL